MVLVFLLRQFFLNQHGLDIIKDPQIKNLYFAAAGSHPGAGIPGVLCSAKIVEKVIKKDFKLN